MTSYVLEPDDSFNRGSESFLAHLTAENVKGLEGERLRCNCSCFAVIEFDAVDGWGHSPWETLTVVELVNALLALDGGRVLPF